MRPDSAPVYRRPRSHAYSCRCPRCVQPNMKNGDYGIIGPAILAWFAVTLFGFWPAMVWHGYTDTGGWRWDIHSTVAELVYWGTIGFTVFLCWLGNRPAKTSAAVPVTPERLPPPPSVCVPRPVCLHLNAVKVESILDPDKAVAYWCEECGTQLDEKFGRFARSCCGTPPGTPHLYNCAHRKAVTI